MNHIESTGSLQSPGVPDPSYKEKILKTFGVNLSLDHDQDTLDPSVKDASVLVLYTGGTIGMRLTDGVYAPSVNFLVHELRRSTLFNDHAYVEQHFSTDRTDKPLVLPPTRAGCSIVYSVFEYEPLLDSSNITMNDWTRIATDIFANYDKFNGFVVLHGTDTMAYTASALSFICENLGKPVVLTGSQIPIFEIRSDGRDNFLSSLVIAGTSGIPEVLICFNDKLFRGNRTTKVDCSSFGAFDSPNMSPLATLQISVKIDWPSVYRSGATEKFTVQTNLCQNVGVLRLFPSITIQTVRAFLQPPMQGVVLQTYGQGNAPSARVDLLQLFKEATNWGVIIVNITQCSRGAVIMSYETGKALHDAGVIGGGDMCTEAALTKLSYILGKDSWTLNTKRKMMGRNLRGEMTAVAKEELSLKDLELIETVAKTMSISTKEEIVQLRDALYPPLMCAAAKIGAVQTLEKLRQSGVNISSCDYDDRTALHIASGEGHLPVVQYLLHHGASVHARDRFGSTPLIDAVHGRHLDIIKLLVQTGASLTSSLQSTRLAMELCCAASQNDVGHLEAWYEAGADLSTADYDLRTPLHVAVCSGMKEAVEFLVKHGAQLDRKDIFGNTPLSQAQQSFSEIVEILNHTNLT